MNASYGGGKDLYQQDYKKWLKTAMGKAAAWDEKIRSASRWVAREWIVVR
jgi:hypothetical protein